MYVCSRFHNYLCTHFPEDKMKSSRTGRGQLFEAEVEAEDKSSRPRTKFCPRGQLGLEDLTSLDCGVTITCCIAAICCFVIHILRVFFCATFALFLNHVVDC